jgi:hypothetical protein
MTSILTTEFLFNDTLHLIFIMWQFKSVETLNSRGCQENERHQLMVKVAQVVTNFSTLMKLDDSLLC